MIMYYSKQDLRLAVRFNLKLEELLRLKNHWVNARQRCYNKNDASYYRYGARGIRVYTPWIGDLTRNDRKKNQRAFYLFVRWICIKSKIGPRPKGLTRMGLQRFTLDRIDNDRGYFPGNYRWSTPEQQMSNRSDYVRMGKLIRFPKKKRIA